MTGTKTLSNKHCSNYFRKKKLQTKGSFRKLINNSNLLKVTTESKSCNFITISTKFQRSISISYH
ncbi:hypothetical protein Hanom_Chr10g00908451 [Helianthus anomalus]